MGDGMEGSGDGSIHAAVRRRHPRRIFSREEDAKLTALVNGMVDSGRIIDWGWISQQMPNRNVRQVHERWMNYLNPSLNNNRWTAEEDEMLVQKVSELGHSWRKIAAFFPGRTDISLRSRWQVKTRERRHREQVQVAEDMRSGALQDIMRASALPEVLPDQADVLRFLGQDLGSSCPQVFTFPVVGGQQVPLLPPPHPTGVPA